MARREGREAALAYIYHTPECISQKTYKDPCKNYGYFKFLGSRGNGRNLANKPENVRSTCHRSDGFRIIAFWVFESGELNEF